MRRVVEAVAWLAVLAFAGWLLVGLVQGCGPATVRATHVTVVTAGGAVAAIQAEHERAYRTGTDALRERLAATGQTIEAYDREVAPLDAAFGARGRAIQALAGDLYSAAAVNDAVRRGASPADYGRLAGELLAGIARTLAVLREGAVLPAVAIPPEVDQVVAALRSITHTEDHDAAPAP